LIKLDLSSNSLSEIPLKFSSFSLLKILYLHDNQITNIAITKTKLEYISLFDNVIKNYRHNLIDNNDKLMGIDFNIVTKSERLTKTTPRKYSQIKWPIVEISSNL
jgi:Leucine-rich repeat (LRR) protein